MSFVKKKTAQDLIIEQLDRRRMDREKMEMRRPAAGRGALSRPLGPGQNRKYNTKNSNYVPGKAVRVPAIEESLYKEDDLG